MEIKGRGKSIPRKSVEEGKNGGRKVAERKKKKAKEKIFLLNEILCSFSSSLMMKNCFHSWSEEVELFNEATWVGKIMMEKNGGGLKSR